MATAEQKEKWQEAFNLFDKEGNKTIKTSDLGTVVRSLGLNPTQAEIKEWQGTVDASGSGAVNFDDFCNLMVQKQGNTDSEIEVIEAFRVFDKDGSGTISCNELKHVLTTLGEKLTDSEVEEVIKEADADSNGYINYTNYVKMMMSK